MWSLKKIGPKLLVDALLQIDHTIKQFHFILVIIYHQHIENYFSFNQGKISLLGLIMDLGKYEFTLFYIRYYLGHQKEVLIFKSSCFYEAAILSLLTIVLIVFY